MLRANTREAGTGGPLKEEAKVMSVRTLSAQERTRSHISPMTYGSVNIVQSCTPISVGCCQSFAQQGRSIYNKMTS
jgi:hypothetical protein